MRLGGGIIHEYHSPEQWLREVRSLGYSAVIFPVDSSSPVSVQNDYLSCIKDNGLLIGEVGIWKNVLSEDKDESERAIEYSIAQLELAERVGANCCVNISGSLDPDCWDGYHPLNYAPQTYERIVSVTQRIIDAVKPKNTYFSLEPMPWAYPDSPESYLKLIKDIDRGSFAVHLDFANMINGIERYHNSADFIEKCFKLLGKHIRSIHIKDVKLTKDLPFCLREALPGEGELNLARVLQLIEALGADTPAFTEHLDTHEQYIQAVSHLRGIAPSAGVIIK